MKLIPDDIGAFLEFNEVISINELIRNESHRIIDGVEDECKKAKAMVCSEDIGNKSSKDIGNTSYW